MVPDSNVAPSGRVGAARGIPVYSDPQLDAILRGGASTGEWHQRSLYVGVGLLAAVADAPYGRSEAHCRRLRQAAALTGARAVISLGPGDAFLDRRIVAALGAKPEKPRYIPVDLNRTFLGLAADALCDTADVPFAVALDFETRLGLLRQALFAYAVSARPVLITLAGGTFGNLDLLESNFIDQATSVAEPGDYVMFDAVVAADAAVGTATCDTPAVRRFLAAGVARQTGAALEDVLASYWRMQLSTAGSDVPGTKVTLMAYDCPVHGRVPVLRFCQYAADELVAWASRLAAFEVVAPDLCQPAGEGCEFGVLLLRRR